MEGGGSAPGLGLLNAHSVLTGAKTRRRVRGRVVHAEGVFAALTGSAFEGYELHMGRTEAADAAFAALDGEPDGCASGNVLGTYVHGLFDRGGFASALVNCLLAAKGLPQTARAGDWAAVQERELDRLAAAVRESIDMKLVYGLIND